MSVKRIAAGGLHSFLAEAARVSKTSSLHFYVQRTPHGYVVEHHWGRWRAYVEPWGVKVEADDGHVLVATKEEMSLDGEKIDEVCAPGEGCYKPRDVVRLTVYSIALWHWHINDPHDLRQFAHLA